MNSFQLTMNLEHRYRMLFTYFPLEAETDIKDQFIVDSFILILDGKIFHLSRDKYLLNDPLFLFVVILMSQVLFYPQ